MRFKRFLQKEIKAQRGNMWLSLGSCVFLFLLGLGITLWFFKSSASFGTYPDLLKVGPLIITSAAALFPLKSFQSYRTRLIAYKYLLDQADEDEAATAQM